MQQFVKLFFYAKLSNSGWNTLTGHKEALESLTLEQFNSFLKDMWNGQNRIQVIMTGVAEQ